MLRLLSSCGKAAGLLRSNCLSTNAIASLALTLLHLLLQIDATCVLYINTRSASTQQRRLHMPTSLVAVVSKLL